jgi:HlyD family secretion protein
VRALALVVSAVLVLSCASSCARSSEARADAAVVSASTSSPAADTARAAVTEPKREIRLTGIVEAVHSSKVMVPTTTGNSSSQVTLTHIIPNGSRVEAGDMIAEFDPTQEIERAFTARGKADDLAHQVEQKGAQNRADSEKRKADLTQAQADLDKATLELQKAPILAAIVRDENEIKAQIAREHLASLQKSNALHDASDAAALKVLELQRDRQQVALQKAQDNIDRLQVKAPIAGLVAHQNLYRGNSYGRPQEGDQLYRGQALVSIFDPGEMLVRCSVGEPDGAALKPGVRAIVRFDAYPDLTMPAHFEFASPIATAALGTPIKTFTAIFKLDGGDPRLMPDLSAAVVIGDSE